MYYVVTAYNVMLNTIRTYKCKEVHGSKWALKIKTVGNEMINLEYDVYQCIIQTVLALDGGYMN